MNLKSQAKLLVIAALFCLFFTTGGCLPSEEEQAVEVEEKETVEVEQEVVVAEETENETVAEDEIPDNGPVPQELKKDNEQTLPFISDGNYLFALVTKETSLKQDYRPHDLQAVPDYMYPSYNMQLRSEALYHLESLWSAAAVDGITLHIRSAYRSYGTQEWLFNDYAARHGEEEANRFSARPGQSEHQLGTAVDFGGTAVDFKAAFAETPQGLWLAENAYRFGFAMSYPENSEHITGYIFEPWHYRYIGIEAASEWKASGLTLTEFLAGKPQDFQ